MINDENLVNIIKTSKSRSEVCEKFGKHNNEKTMNDLNNFIQMHNISINHFIRKNAKVKIIKECPVCLKFFETFKNTKEKTTCSNACANTFFRSGSAHPNWKENPSKDSLLYRRICFKNHKYECIICGENKIVAVHHYDKNHKNNAPENLIPMCPTHHQYLHSKYKNEIIDKVNNYRNDFIKKNSGSD